MNEFEQWWASANTRLTDLPKAQAKFIWDAAQNKQAEPVAQPYAYVYEFDSRVFGIHRSFSSNERNGSKPSRVVPVYTHPAPAVDLTHMVNRFLGWKLPMDFAPDCGISIDTEIAGRNGWPSGTNLLNAEQAKQMFEYVTQVTPAVAPQHPDDEAVDKFAAAMKQKLAQAREKGRSGWEQMNPADLSAMLREHVEKGDPRDVANFCMFLWSLGYAIEAVKPADADESMWCRYIASMIGQYLGEPLGSEKEKAIAGIIERRLWNLPKPAPAVAHGAILRRVALGLLKCSKANFTKQFGVCANADWVYRDLEELFSCWGSETPTVASPAPYITTEI